MGTRALPPLLLAWLAGVIWLDQATHPYIVAGILYVPVVAIVAWYWGWKPAGALSMVAVGLHVYSDEIYHLSSADSEFVHANEAMVATMILSTGWISARLAEQRRTIVAQRDAMGTMRDQMANEMSEARDLQNILNQYVPQHPALDLATCFKPARILGGDAVKAWIEGDRLVLVLADVSGKGAPAALASSVLLGLLPETTDAQPASVLAYLNERLVGHLAGEKFVTLVYLTISLSDGTLTYASAGHEPVLLLRNGQIDELSSTGLILGVALEADYTQTTLQLSPGDLLFGYTDGVIDIVLPNDERLGRAPLDPWLLETATASCTGVLENMLRHTGQEAVQVLDDITMFAVRWKGLSGPRD